ncbi:MAG: ribonuclease J [Oscillospiraceae bacterium]|nr:ribonuclease J [Oscillospiraceae bacterium]
MPENIITKKNKPAFKGDKKNHAQIEKNNQKNSAKRSAKQKPFKSDNRRRKNALSDDILNLTEQIAKNQVKKTSERRTAAVKITALGGLGEIGKNLYVFECSNDLFIVDCGLAFPDEDMLGVDIVIPDYTYLEKNRERFRGIILTHGHEDHIGGLPYLLKKINVPVYGTKLTLGLCEGKLREHGILSQCSLNVIQPRQTVKMGCMSVEFIRVNHSIPDACALAIHTPAGIIVHTGDFKVDYTPIEGGIIDLARLGELGNRGVLALLSDSTNAERPGYTMSERKVGESFRNIFAAAEGRRVIVATFSSNIHRIQQIIDIATLTDRKIALSGRSMLNVVQKAIELSYVKIPKGLLIDIDQVNKYPPEKIVIVTTGSQGEPLSALTRMSAGDHRQVTITPNDLVVISASPIPGNEKTVGRVINDLMKSGAEVVYESMYDVHVSGHACQDELKMMLSLVKPRFFIPIHGEYKHMKKHAQIAMGMGIPEENIFILNLGQQLETDSTEMKTVTQVPAGKVLVDGLGVGDVGAVVLRDRKKLAADGIIVIVATIERESGQILSGPDIVSRGFVYVRESEELMEKARELMTETIKNSGGNNNGGARLTTNTIKNNMRDEMSDFMFAKTKRSPMVLPIIMEI